ncbi:ubiquitin carboxyl-terminal hydrolase 26 [Erethizon dorsatum]
MVSGYAQMWDKKTGMSKAQGVFIETVEGRKNFKLLIYFKNGEVKTFQLNNNIKSVALTSYGKNLSHLHLTFQNNNFLFIEKLSSMDAEQLKMFLDRVPRNSADPHVSTEKREGMSTSTATQTSEESETQHRKEGRMQSSDSELNESEKLPIKKSNTRKKSKANPLKYKSHGWKKQLKARELKKNKKLASVLLANHLDHHLLDNIDFQHLTENTLQQLVRALNCSEDDPEPKLPHKHYTQAPWQGLPNLGNTCYINAVLQSLCSIPLFVNDVLNRGFPWGRISRDIFCLCMALLLIMKDTFDMTVKEKLLVIIQNTISLVAEIFAMNTQNDAHEFLSFCLDQMKKALRKSNIVCKSENKSEEENSPQQAFAGDSAVRVTDCPVMTNFECELLCSILCKACGQAVYKTEPSTYLSINLPQGKKACPLSIQSTFDHFFETEELEYKCERCKHNRSDVVHKFSRLPRILIVHLKRYRFNEFLSLRKNEQAVTVSKYLDLSSHCNEGTKPPVPLSKNAHIRDTQLLKTFQKLSFKILCSLSLVKSEMFKDSTGKRVKSGKDPDSRKSQRLLKGKNVQQQKDLGKACKMDMRESELVCLGGAALTGEEQLASSVMNLEDTSLSVFSVHSDKPFSSPDTCSTEVRFPRVPENLKVKKSRKTNTFAALDFDGVSETTEGFSKDKKTRIKERSQKVAEQSEERDGMGIRKDAPPQTLPEGVPKPDAQGHRVKLRGCTELNLQKANSGNKDSSNKKTESKTQKPKKKADEKSRYTYRLIGIISHIGNTPYSGHYISDAYDFKRQVWFTYSDLLVSNISESLVQKSRLCTGYIFFYMHNEIFEELLLRVKASESQPESQPQPRPRSKSWPRSESRRRSKSQVSASV